MSAKKFVKGNFGVIGRLTHMQFPTEELNCMTIDSVGNVAKNYVYQCNVLTGKEEAADDSNKIPVIAVENGVATIKFSTGHSIRLRANGNYTNGITRNIKNIFGEKVKSDDQKPTKIKAQQADKRRTQAKKQEDQRAAKKKAEQEQKQARIKASAQRQLKHAKSFGR